MRMKHRWTAGLLVVTTLTLGACAPPDAGADDPSPSPTSGVTEATDAPSMAPESAAPEPTQYGQDEY